MMMRKSIFKIALSSVFVLFSFQLIAQNTNVPKGVHTVTKQMFSYVNAKNYDGILEISYPKIFEILPKKQMKLVFKSTFEGDEDFKLEIPKIKPVYKVSKLYKDSKENLQFAFVSYDMSMNMTFHNQEFDEDGKKMMTNIMKAKGMDVTFTADNAMNVKMNDRVNIVIKDEFTNNQWRILNYDPDSPLFYQIIPTKVLEEAKAYRQDLLLERKKAKN